VKSKRLDPNIFLKFLVIAFDEVGEKAENLLDVTAVGLESLEDLSRHPGEDLEEGGDDAGECPADVAQSFGDQGSQLVDQLREFHGPLLDGGGDLVKVLAQGLQELDHGFGKSTNKVLAAGRKI
jgi:hypothetical protein